MYFLPFPGGCHTSFFWGSVWGPGQPKSAVLWPSDDRAGGRWPLLLMYQWGVCCIGLPSPPCKKASMLLFLGSWEALSSTMVLVSPQPAPLGGEFLGQAGVGSRSSLLPAFTAVCACVLSCSVVSNSFATPWTVACQAPLSIGFSRQESWSGLPLPSPGDLPHQGANLCCLHQQVGSLPLSQQGAHTPA